MADKNASGSILVNGFRKLFAWGRRRHEGRSGPGPTGVPPAGVIAGAEVHELSRETLREAESADVSRTTPFAPAREAEQRAEQARSVREADKDRIRSILDRGIGTQFDRARQTSPTEIVIGLDFGTSATKVVVRAPYFANVVPHALPVPQMLRAEQHPYLWDSRLWIDGSGSFALWREAGTVPIEGMKHALIARNGGTVVTSIGGLSATATEAAVAFLAFVFRYTRGWFLQTKRDAYGAVPLRWLANVGLPAATYDDEELLSGYRSIVAAAWVLSLQAVPISLDQVRGALVSRQARAAASDQNARHELRIAVIPEVAAEVAGFARSTQRRDGLYVLVDVGAGTLDVCTFRLFRNQEEVNCYAMFTAQVVPLGVEAYERLHAAGKSEAALAHDILQAMKDVIWHTKMRRDPTASEWREEVPVFLCGGGSASPPYKRAAQALGPWLAQHAQTRRVPITSLECPDRLDGKGAAEDFHRLAVAWGLSFPETDIGTLMLPSQIPDMRKASVRDVSDGFVSKDHV